MIVETANEDVEVFKQIGQACRSVNHGKEIEFMFASASLAKNVMANTKPIYVKRITNIMATLGLPIFINTK